MYRYLMLFPAFALMACASNSFPVKGTPSDTHQLSGDWTGEFGGAQKGQITFSFAFGRRVADGSVAMKPANSKQAARKLPISYVAVDQQTVSGRLARYVAPECECAVETSFRGDVAGNQIKGTFVTKGVNRQFEREGWWLVTRR